MILEPEYHTELVRHKIHDVAESHQGKNPRVLSVFPKIDLQLDLRCSGLQLGDQPGKRDDVKSQKDQFLGQKFTKQSPVLALKAPEF